MFEPFSRESRANTSITDGLTRGIRLTPDSAPPPPTKMIQDIDPDQIVKASLDMDRLRGRYSSPEQLALRASNFFYISPDEAASLGRLSVSNRLLESLHTEASVTDPSSISWHMR